MEGMKITMSLFDFGGQLLTESAELNNEEEISLEAMQMIAEAAILESLSSAEIIELTENHTLCAELTTSEIVQEKSIVRLDKHARISQAQKMAVFTVAKEKNDPLMKKLITVWRMEKQLEDKLFQKYGSEALRRAKKTIQQNYRQQGSVFTKITNTAGAKINQAMASGKVKAPRSNKK